jgi:hypothetical protein
MEELIMSFYPSTDLATGGENLWLYEDGYSKIVE